MLNFLSTDKKICCVFESRILLTLVVVYLAWFCDVCSVCVLFRVCIIRVHFVVLCETFGVRNDHAGEATLFVRREWRMNRSTPSIMYLVVLLLQVEGRWSDFGELMVGACRVHPMPGGQKLVCQAGKR